jgi:Mycobacterium membrane protein
MSDSPRPGSSSDPTDPYGGPYQGYSDPAYAGSAPGPSYAPAAVPQNPAPTEPLPQYWTQTYPQSGPMSFDQPPEPPRGPRPWLWAAAGFAVAVVLGMVVWLVYVNTNPASQTTSIPAMPSSTIPRTTTPRTTSPPMFPLPIPLPTLTFPSTPSSAPSGETEPVVYEVSGTGRAINITYIDTGGVMQTEFNVLLPWHKEVSLPKPAREAASVTVINAGRTITCAISIGGVQVQQRSGAVLTICSPSG